MLTQIAVLMIGQVCVNGQCSPASLSSYVGYSQSRQYQSYVPQTVVPRQSFIASYGTPYVQGSFSDPVLMQAQPSAQQSMFMGQPYTVSRTYSISEPMIMSEHVFSSSPVIIEREPGLIRRTGRFLFGGF